MVLESRGTRHSAKILTTDLPTCRLLSRPSNAWANVLNVNSPLTLTRKDRATSAENTASVRRWTSERSTR